MQNFCLNALTFPETFTPIFFYLLGDLIFFLILNFKKLFPAINYWQSNVQYAEWVVIFYTLNIKSVIYWMAKLSYRNIKLSRNGKINFHEEKLNLKSHFENKFHSKKKVVTRRELLRVW